MEARAPSSPTSHVPLAMIACAPALIQNGTALPLCSDCADHGHLDVLRASFSRAWCSRTPQADCGPRTYTSNMLIDLHGLMGNLTMLLQNATETIQKTVDTDVSQMQANINTQVEDSVGAAQAFFTVFIIIAILCCACSAVSFWFFKVRPMMEQAKGMTNAFPGVVEMSDGQKKQACCDPQLTHRTRLLLDCLCSACC